MPYMAEELLPKERANLPTKDFVFPKSRTWPIQDIEQAKTALTYASWPKNRDAAKAVRTAVFRRYPKLKGWATVGKSKYKAPWQKERASKQESIGNIGGIPGIADRLGALSELLGESQVGVNHDPRGIGRTDGILSSHFSEANGSSNHTNAMEMALKWMTPDGLYNEVIKAIRKTMLKHAEDKAEMQRALGHTLASSGAEHIKNLVMATIRMAGEKYAGKRHP